MIRFKKVMNLCIIAALSVSVFAGCSKNTASTGDSQATDSKSKEVTLRFTWWGGDARHKATLDAINLYTQKNPNVKINAEYSGMDGYYQKLVTQLSGNTAPDIIQIDTTWIAELKAQGEFFADLSQQKAIDTKVFDENFLKMYSLVDNKIIGLPTGINASALLFNQDFFNKMGLDTKTVWTWDNLTEAAKKVHEKDKNAYLMNFDSTQSYYLLKMNVIQKTGKPWVNEDYTIGFDKQTITDSFKYLDNLFKIGGIQPLAETAPFQGKIEQNPKWLNGQAGMLWSWSSVYSGTKATIPSLALAIPPLDTNAKDSGIVVRPSQLLSINKNSKNVEEAAKFLNWFFSDPEAAKALGDARGVPATEVARKVLVDNNKLDPILNSATAAATKAAGKPENGISQNQELEKITVDIIQQLGFAKLTPEKAADELISRYTQKLTEIKGQKK